MSLASTFYDPVIGLDIHLMYVPSPAPVPTPIPLPFVGLVFDPAGLVVGAGLSALMTGSPGITLVNGMPVTNVGTTVTSIMTAPHPPLPPSPPTGYVQGLPGNDAELMLGGFQTGLGGSFGVRLGDLAMSCGDPVRLPMSAVLAIPKGPPVLLGAPAAPDLVALAMRRAMGAGFKLLGSAARGGAKVFRAVRRTQRSSDLCRRASARLRVANEVNPSRARSAWNRAVCFVTGHPVDVVTGRMFTELVDFELPGPLPLKFERAYDSSLSWRSGPLGPGWSHTLDEAVWPEPGKLVYRAGDGREIEFSLLDEPGRTLRIGGSVYHPVEGLTLRRTGAAEFEIREKSGIARRYASLEGDRSGEARLLHIESRCGHHRIELSYDKRGCLEWVRDACGRIVRFEHDKDGRLTSIRLPLRHGQGFGLHRRFHYDDEGDLVRAEDALGASWRYDYVSHLMVQETDRTGLSFYFEYDARGPSAKCVRTWGDGGIYDHVIHYDDANGRTIVENSQEEVTVYVRDAANQVVAVIDPHGRRTEYGYCEETGKQSYEADPLGARTEMVYDARGNIIRLTLADGSSWTTRYDERFDLPVEIRAPTGARWRMGYDALGHLTTEIDPANMQTHYAWRGGLLREVTEASGASIRYDYDERKQLASAVLPNGGEATIKYDGQGAARKVRDARGAVTEAARDAEGRMLEVRSPLGLLERMRYDAEGNLLESLNATRHVKLRYGGFHWVSAREEAGTELRFEHDTEGRLVAVLNEASERYEFELDGAGEVLRERPFGGGERTYLRDGAGRVKTVLRPSGQKSEQAYDALGRLIELRHSDGSFALFAYDALGSLVRAETESGAIELERDALGRVIAERTLPVSSEDAADASGEGAYEVRSSYGAHGLRERMETSLGARARIGRDALGEVSSLRFGWHAEEDGSLLFGADPLNLGSPDVVFERDALGLEKARRFSTAFGGLETQWGRDIAGRPTERRVSALGSAETRYGELFSLGAPRQEGERRELDMKRYEWRGEDQIASIISASSGAALFDHDARGRLIRERRPARDEVIERAMDAVGNVFRTASQRDRRYGAGGRLEEAAGVRYEYDADGNQTAKIHPDGATWRYAWDGHGMLREVERPDGSKVAFEYDAFARRTKKRLLSAVGEVLRETRYVWDGHVIVHELESDEDELITWRFEPETFTPVAKEKGERRWAIASDHLGTPTEMVDELGKLTWKMQLDVLGVPAFEEGDAAHCPFRWPGQYEDEETGLYYNRWRYLDAHLARYLSTDPLGLTSGTHAYSYVKDASIETDPFGLIPWANPTVQGHHIVPYSAAKYLNISPFDSQYGVPTFYFSSPYKAGSHELLHGAGALTRPALTKASVEARGLNRRSWLQSLHQNYSRPEIQQIRGNVHIVTRAGRGEIIASNVSPYEAWVAAMNWAKNNQSKSGACK